VFIDVLIIRAYGAVYEAAMMGIREALGIVTFPQLIVTPGETLAELHFDIDDSKEAVTIIDKEKLPFVMSFAVGSNLLLLDPTPLEISVLQSQLVIGILPNGLLVGLNHFGECGMKPSALAEVTEQAQIALKQFVG
jgi:exosome complex RNA-binding protein Rrp42 (RNase PH superfamily)